MSDDQADVIALLSDPATFDTDSVERVDTHISSVFLAGDKAYKLKRAVRLPYLDFTTLERRRRACEAELTINRRLAPELYLDIRPISRAAAGGLCLGDGGEAVDWVVVMRRFPAEMQLDEVCARGELRSSTMTTLVDRIAACHAAAPPDKSHGSVATLRRAVDGVAATLRDKPGAVDPTTLARWTDTIGRRLAGNAALIETRRVAGKVRDGHGDLHLRNICLVDDEPVPFDALEFDKALSCIDVLYDLAFLVMDLAHRGQPDLASVAFNRYLDRGDEADGLPLLPMFLSLRAAIRAQAEAAGKRPSADAARAYLDDAVAMLDPSAPRLVAIGGPSGSGKSTLGASLAPTIGAAPGARLVHSDVIRKRLWGVPAEQKLPADAYAADMHRRVYRALADEACATLAAGRSAIADAVFGTEAERRAIEQVAVEAGVPFSGLWLSASPEAMERRIADRRGDASDATPEILAAQLAGGFGAIRWHVLESGGDRRIAVARATEIVSART